MLASSASSLALASIMLFSAWRVALSTSLPASAASTRRKIWSSKSSPILVVNARGFQQGLDIADGMGSHLQLLHQPTDDVFLEGALQDDVEDADAGMLGGEPLDAPDALLDDHRVPGQVVVHQHIGDLKIDAFRPRFGRDDNVTVGRIFPEPLDGLLVALPGRAIDDTDFQPALFEEGLNGRLRLDRVR